MTTTFDRLRSRNLTALLQERVHESDELCRLLQESMVRYPELEAFLAQVAPRTSWTSRQWLISFLRLAQDDLRGGARMNKSLMILGNTLREQGLNWSILATLMQWLLEGFREVLSASWTIEHEIAWRSYLLTVGQRLYSEMIVGTRPMTHPNPPSLEACLVLDPHHERDPGFKNERRWRVLETCSPTLNQRGGVPAISQMVLKESLGSEAEAVKEL